MLLTGAATAATPRLYWLVPLAALVAALAIWLLLPASAVLELMSEGGPLETATAVLYGVGVVILCAARRRLHDDWAFAALVLFMTLLMARELDLHLILTGSSVLRLSYYLRGDFAPGKALALLVVASFLFTLGYFARVAWRRGWWRAPLQAWRDPLTAPALVFVASILVAKTLDRTVSIVSEDFGIPVSASIAALVVACEEMLELGLPLLVALAVMRLPPQQPAPPAA
jgi:hypothetical protein